MRKYQKKMVEDFIETLFEAHDEIRKLIKINSLSVAMELLSQCQDGIIKVGTMIEESEGEGFDTVVLIEGYCELVYNTYEAVRMQEETGQSSSFDKLYKALNKKLIQVRNSIKNDIKYHIEAVFLPYKASMWDSLESVWAAADADEGCDAYVIPIPYYDKNPDGSLGEEHWEGKQYPDYVPVTHYAQYDFAAHKPDMVFIHNPYDEYNTVTSVHPFYYSKNLKQYTERLIYVPYYSTAGGMSMAQGNLPAYYYVDHIAIQAENYRDFFAKEISDEKFLPLGSPKFDSVIKACQNPPKPPEEWWEKLKGRKVFFYNTSIGGMLGDTKAFLRKLEYVFSCFEGRDDVCLIWRPHPLLESTFASMRGEEKAEFDRIKQGYLEKDFGIYDDTPDMIKTIALCDAYVGDAGTSVTSLFGIVGKPMFILNNYIHKAPQQDDWKGYIINAVPKWLDSRWMITQGNKLYHSLDENYQYEYYCDLSEYGYGSYYTTLLEINDRLYVFPQNAQEILIIDNHKVVERIPLQKRIQRAGAFAGAIACDSCIFLIPNQYPDIVRFEPVSREVSYIDDYPDVFKAQINGEIRIGGLTCLNGWLFLASPVDSRILAIHGKTGKMQLMTTGGNNTSGCITMIPDGEDLWLLPFEGTTITRWNPVTGDLREYNDFPEDLECHKLPQGDKTMERPFNGMVIQGDDIYLSPLWANMYIKLNKTTGKAVQWKPLFETPEVPENGCFVAGDRSRFLLPARDSGWDLKKPSLIWQNMFGSVYDMFSVFDRKLYRVNLETEEYEEIPIEFDVEELERHDPGFCENSQWMQYSCYETPFNTLTDFLDDKISGGQFDRERQLKAFRKINAVQDGTSGERIYEFVRKTL